MKARFAVALSLTLMAPSLPTLAHDPSLHKKEGTAPECAKMKDMDMSKMDMSDPVAKAMQQQCRDQMKDHDEDAEPHDHSMTNAPGPQTKTPPAADVAKP
jgi:hypothetical protein